LPPEGLAAKEDVREFIISQVRVLGVNLLEGRHGTPFECTYWLYAIDSGIDFRVRSRKPKACDVTAGPGRKEDEGQNGSDKDQ
jgi:hypothetical protein